MGIVNGIGIVNNLLAGDLSGAQLQSYLSTGSHLASFIQVIHVRRQMQPLMDSSVAVAAMAASSIAMTAIAASSTAMLAAVNSSAAATVMAASSPAMTAINANDQAVRIWMLRGTAQTYSDFANVAAVAASSTAMGQVAASGAAMAAVAASSTAMTAIAASSTAMLAVIASDAATAAVAASGVAMTAINANDQAVRIWMLKGTAQLYSDFANVAAVAASSTAMTAVAASAVAMAQVIASNTALTAVAASSVAMGRVVLTAVAKMAVFNSDVALAAVVASSTALTALRSGAQYTVRNSTAYTPTAITVPSAPAAGGSYIVLGLSTNALNGVVSTLATRRSGSAVNTSVTSDGTGSDTTALKYPAAMPMVTPFTFTQTGTTGYTWYFGMLRCDV